MTATGPALPGMRCLQDLGSGGFADVHLYERDQPRIKVAVKLLKIDKVSEAERRQFTAEADAMAELAEHPYIVSVLGADTAPDGRPYLVMNYYPGPDLLQQVSTKPLSVAAALRTGIKLAGAVETAHRAGIIHRDIKPANVLMSSYGEPGLSDFGIAGRNGAAEDDDQVGVSIPWAAPEVITGQSNGTVASDVYSLTATIWHLLVGRSPFSVPGDNAVRRVTARILHDAVPSTGRADAPHSLDRVLQQGMAKRPDLRPQSAMQLGRLLQGVEQELRLARTPIVVPDPADTAPEPVETSPDAAAEATMLKRPVTVRPTPTKSADEPAWEEPTDRRPPRIKASVAEAEVTERRHQRVSPAQPEAELEAGHAGPTPRHWLPMAAVGVLLVIAAGVGIALANSGKGGAGATDLPNAPQQTTLDQLGGAAPVVPDVTAQTQGSSAVFSAPAAPAGTAYSWILDPPGGFPSPIAGSDGKATITVPLDPTAKTCVRLKVVVGNRAASGDQVCAP